MNKIIIVVIIVVFLIIIGIFGWSYFFNRENLLIGTWTYKDYQESTEVIVEYNFFDDQKFLHIISYQFNQSWFNQTYLGKYEFSDEILTMTYENNLPAEKEDFLYTVTNNSIQIYRKGENTSQLPSFSRVSIVPLRKFPIADKPITASAESMTLSIDEIPQDYIYCANRTYEHGILVSPIESHSVIYAKGDCSNQTEGLFSIIMKFKSSFDAGIFYNSTKLPVVIEESQQIIVDSVDTIGDESFAHYVGEELNNSQIYFWFRVSNIAGLVKVPFDYSLTRSLTELVEQKIYDHTQ